LAGIVTNQKLAYESINIVGSLLLTNSDFRLFLSDLNTALRQVFADTAKTLANAADDAAKQIKPSAEDGKVLKNPGREQGPAPTIDDLGAKVAEITSVVTQGLKETGNEAYVSLKDNLSGDQRDTLLFRLKAAVTKLRKRDDYSDLVSIIGLLIQRYAKVYFRGVDETLNTVRKDINTNEELDRAMRAGWSVLSSFGDKIAWKELEAQTNRVMEHSRGDPKFEKVVEEIAISIQKMLTDPDFFESAGSKFDELKEKAKKIGNETPLRQDIEGLLQQSKITFESAINDQDVSKLIRTTSKIWSIVSPTRAATNPDLFVDIYTVFMPHLIQAIQYIPIPRLEVSVPDIDLLLENLILEPGRTVNNSSFLPFKLNIGTYNDLTIRKARMRTISTLYTLVTMNIQGMSIRAEEVGYWLRAHKGLFHLADSGIASLELDDRGIDIALDVEVGKDHLEKILSLRAVRVKIHHLSYTLHKSKFTCLAWLFKPVLRPIIRKALEHQLSTAIADGLHAANRELLYARERLRATRISDPQDLRTFIKAIVTRLTPEVDPDLYASVGVVGGANQRGNIFAGVYAPGSVVKLWQEETGQAGARVDDNVVQGWRNEIFDVQTRALE
jgi:Family of unknown function (DUF5923)/Protein of unknown function (DUF4449)